MRSLCLLFCLLLPQFVWAFTEGICNPFKEHCTPQSGSTSSPAYPNSSSSFRVNPSAVPLDNRFGIESIDYNNQFDFGLVRGNGRVGAAVSPSNGEETFFGPPGFETDQELLERKEEKQKFHSTKVSFAAAVNILSNKKTGLEHAQLNIGAIGHYNTLSKNAYAGYGVTLLLGPVQLGYSESQDEFLLNEDTENPYQYKQTGYSAGVYLNSLALDYSQMQITGDQITPVTIRLATASILLKRWILTASQRMETSDRPDYDYDTKTLVYDKIKTKYFYGVQFALLKSLLVGAFYNYYLLNEYSAGATFFF